MFTSVINGITLTFETNGCVFSPSAVDRGTLAMLSQARIEPDEKLLDLGCGYGAVGIYAAKLIGEENVWMSDIDENCVELAKINAARNGVGGISVIQSDGFTGLDEKDYTLILSNPPYQSDFSLAKHFIVKGFNRLALGGEMMMVTKRLEWYRNKFTAIFGGVRVREVDGYYVFTAQKRNKDYAKSVR